MKRLLLPVILLLLGPVLVAQAQTLERIQESDKIRIGYRTDAPPFSYTNELGEPAGYSVQLCKLLALGVKLQLEMDQLEPEYVAVTAEDRFEQVAAGNIDVLCGATTQTLARRQLVDFSIPTFIDGASVLYRKDGPSNFEALAGEKIGVRTGTTTEEALRGTLEDLSIAADIVSVGDHNEGLRALEEGEIAAYFADQAILLFLLGKSGAPDQLVLSERHFTVEPYALALQRGDSDFRLAVDTVLSRVYRRGKIAEVFSASFGGRAKPTEMIKALYLVSPLPE